MAEGAMRRITRSGLIVVTATAVTLGVIPARAEVTASDDPTALAAAAVVDGSLIASAQIVTKPPSGTPLGIGNSSVGGFPTHGETFLVMSSGNATVADQPGASASWNLGGGAIRGNTDRDVSILRLDLNVPAGRNCLRLDFKFLSREYPVYVGSAYNDAFIAELDESTWTTDGSSITATNNFAFDQDGNPVSINSSGVSAMTADEAQGTPYGGATPRLRATTPISSGDGNGDLPGNHSLFLSVFDQGDNILDSVAFIDNIAVGTVPDPATQCTPGAKNASAITAEPAILDAPVPDATVNFPALKAMLTDAFSEEPLAGKTVLFYPVGATEPACEAVTGEDGAAACEDVAAQIQVLLAGGYTAVFSGDETYSFSSADAPVLRVAGTDLP